MIQKKKITGTKLLTALLVSLWILVTIWVLGLFGFKAAWPTFTVLNLVVISTGGITKENIIKVFISCTSGILLALGFLYASTYTTPLIGYLESIYLWLFIIVMILVTFDELFPKVINTYALIVLTYALVDGASFMQDWPKILLSVYIGGGFVLAGLVGVGAIMAKLAIKKSEPQKKEAI